MSILPLLLLALTTSAPDAEALVGYRSAPIELSGPAEHREAVGPVWVYAYPKLKLRYRASGTLGDDAAVLTLAPGSVGPVTPGATNPENPFVAGMPVVVVRGRDLSADGQSQALEVDLGDKMKTPQIHELRWNLPEGATLAVEELTFVGGPDLLPGKAPAPPAGATAWSVEAPVAAGAWRGTTLRGEETIRITGEPRAGRSFVLALSPHFINVGRYAKDAAKESRETADVIARITYADGGWDEAFPFSIAERQHVLINKTPALYALELDADRPVQSVELLDRSPHVQLFVAAAGISDEAPPAPLEALPASSPRSPGAPASPPVVSLDYRLETPEPVIAVDISTHSTPKGRRAELKLKNDGAKPIEFTLTFPSAKIQATDDPNDAAYLFPRRGTIISTGEAKLEAVHNAAFPLQFVDVFAPKANRGAALIVEDAEGIEKTFRLQKTGADIVVEVDYRLRLEPGESWNAPEARLAFHGGDWREGFAAYRSWVETRLKPAAPRPAWLREAFWARRDYPVGGSGELFDVKKGHYTFDALIEDGRAFGGIDFIDISGWAMTETRGRVGDYSIDLGGPADLARNIAKAREQGIPTGLYFEGYLVDKRSKIGEELIEGSQLIDKDGKGRWWRGGEATEFFACPYEPKWRAFLARRVAEVVAETGAEAVYLDEFGFGGKRCFSTKHGHRPGVDTLRGEIEAAAAVRRALEDAGAGETMLYIEEAPPDVAAPHFDAAFCYALPYSNAGQTPLRLNLSRFAFPDVRLWDMVSIGINPRALEAEEFRLSLWHGNGLWLKGDSRTWYGEKLLAWTQKAHSVLKEHAEAFAGPAEPLVASPHPSVFINRFGEGPKAVHTLFNASYRTARFSFQGRDYTLAPRDVVVAPPG